MNAHFRRCIAVCLLLMLPATAACGRKTNPLTPDSPRPEAVTNIRVATRDAAAYLSWSLPARNVEGKDLRPSDISGMRIYRAEFGKDRKRSRYRLYADIDMANPSPAIVRNNTVSWTDEQITYGRIYGYRIRVISARGGSSPLSAEVWATPLLSLAVPQELSAVGRDGYVQLAWKPVKAWLDGSPAEDFVGYNIYRGTEPDVYEESPLNKKPLTTTSYKDTSVVNDRTYYYVVRSVDSPTPVWRESTDSPEAAATPRDQTPPSRPTGLTAVPGVDRVFLTWNENTERDFAGYHVYRSTRSGRDYQKLTDKLLARTTYSDDTVKSGTTYYYVVTAADLYGNESARSEENTVFVEKLR